MQDKQTCIRGMLRVEKEHNCGKFALDILPTETDSDEAETLGKMIAYARNFAKKIVKRSLAYAIINMSIGWKDAERAIIGPVG